MTVVSSPNPVHLKPELASAPASPDGTNTLARLERELSLLEIFARTAAIDDVDDASQELANGLQRWLDVRQVVIGLDCGPRRRCRVKAISGTRTISRQSQVVRCIEAAMDEATMRNELDSKDLSSIDGGKATVLQKELAHVTNSTIVINGPLRNRDGEIVGAWVALDNSSQRGAASIADCMRAAESRVGLCLHILGRSQRHSLNGRLARLFHKTRRSKWQVIMGATIALCAVLLFPMPYKINCKCSVQPVIRRYVVAPYEGMLERAFAEPGDSVTSGQVVAQMDGREIKWELASLEAEYSRAQKERDTNLAGLDASAAQLSRLEMERLKLKIRLLENRAKNLEIKSPVEGIVISGDPKKMEGARLTIGQTLFEIGPLNEMKVEVAVPDEDISHVDTGQSVTIRFESQPTRDYTGQITKIHPRADKRDEANVFIAEVRLENIDGTLRAGMQGRARVRTASHPIGWNLFHKVWQRIAFRMGW